VDLDAVVAQMLAHQGGWDEILMVGAPVLVFAGLLWLARRRAEQFADARDAAAAAAAGDAESTESDRPAE